MTIPYGESTNAEIFKYSGLLVLSNRVIAFLYALGMTIKKKESILQVQAPIYTYALVALSNFVATYCQYEALKFVR